MCQEVENCSFKKRIPLNTARVNMRWGHAHSLPRHTARAMASSKAMPSVPRSARGQGSQWPRQLPGWPGEQSRPVLHLTLLPSSPSCPPVPTTHPQLLFFFRNFPVPTHGSSCSVQRENKTKNKLKSQNTKRIACFASRKLLALSPESPSHTLRLLLRGVGSPCGRRAVGGALTAPGQMCPAGPRSGPPFHSPLAAAPWGRNSGAARQSVAAGVWWWAGAPWRY